jgi:hypothetical protein
MESYFGAAHHIVKKFLPTKKVIRIMEGYGNRVSCRDSFKKLHIFPLKSQYLLSLLMFVAQNKDFFMTNIESHNLDTAQANLAIYQKGTYYSGIKFYNELPSNIKNVSGNLKIFRSTLKKYLHMNSFYTLDQYLEHES